MSDGFRILGLSVRIFPGGTPKRFAIVNKVSPARTVYVKQPGVPEHGPTWLGEGEGGGLDRVRRGDGGAVTGRSPRTDVVGLVLGTAVPTAFSGIG